MPSAAGVELTLRNGEIAGVGHFFSPDPGFPRELRWDSDDSSRIYVRFDDGRWWTGVGFTRQGESERAIQLLNGAPPQSSRA